MALILLDSCVWGGTRAALLELKHDVVWAGDWETDPGDATLLSVAHSEGRILVTLDKDFGELVIVKGHEHSGIVRLCGFRARKMAPAIHEVVGAYGHELQSGAILTVDPVKVRIRPA